MLLGIVGFIGTGKGTAGDILIRNHSFQSDSFAKSLKDAASMIFGWDRALLEGDTPESRHWREQPDRYWSAKLDKKAFTPRLALQWLGTDACRQIFGDAIWTSSVERRWLEAGKPDTVITDCRFPNEIAMIRDNGGKVIRVQRGSEPAWYQLMLFHNKGYSSEEDLKQINQMRVAGTIPHESETAWIGCQIDEAFVNEGTIEDFEKKLAGYIGGPHQPSLGLE